MARRNNNNGQLLDDCDLWCVVSLPGAVFTAAGAGVKTNLLFFTKGQSTRKIWYYDLTDIKVRKKTPLTVKHFEDSVYDLKSVNPHKKPIVDTRTPEELMDIIEAKGREVAEALAELRSRG